jgi:virginiamycin B lyase
VAGSGYLYWANDYSIGRANLNGTGIDQWFIAVPNGPGGVAGLAVNSHYIYWTNEVGKEVGRAKLNGTKVGQKFITGASFPDAIAAGSRYLYWTNQNSRAIGRARLNGTDVNQHFVGRKDLTELHGVAVSPGR